MEIKIDIATILKDTPKNTKLYSPIFGDVYFLSVEDGIIKVTHQGRMVIFFGDGRYYNYPESEPLLFPSKEMHDWEKFAWKRGDALIRDGCRVIFDKWLDDTYTRFNAVHLITCSGGYFDKPWQNKYTPISNFITKYWRKMTDLETKIYMESLERECGGKLNLITLNIEKQPEFKDGDIVAIVVRKYTHIAIFQSRQEAYIGFYAVLCQNDELLLEEPFREDVGDIELRLATEEEKQQLFDALAKEGKAWDAEKKMLIDLKPKWTPKPFDKVLVRDSKSSKWRANLFSHKNIDEPYYCVYASWNYCIPYEGNEHLLGTTENVKE